jgi:hypothetical protein
MYNAYMPTMIAAGSPKSSPGRVACPAIPVRDMRVTWAPADDATPPLLVNDGVRDPVVSALQPIAPVINTVATIFRKRRGKVISLLSTEYTYILNMR